MNEKLAKFKRIVAQVRDDTGEKFADIRDFLIDCCETTEAAQLIASWAVDFLSEDGTYNGFEPGMQVLLQFLAETSTTIGFKAGHAGHAYGQLVNLLNRGANRPAILEWARAWYEPVATQPRR